MDNVGGGAQRRRSHSAPSNPNNNPTTIRNSFSNLIDSNSGQMLSDAIRLAIQRSHAVCDKKLEMDVSSDSKIFEAEAYNYKEQFVEKNVTAAKSDSPLATDYAPAPFINIRALFGVTKESYERSLCDAPLQGSGAGAGASGSVFFLSADSRYVIKSLPKSETDKLRQVLRSYHQHMSKHNESLLPKFFGLYKLKIGKRWVRVVVMNNAFFTPLEVHQKYDLKGSTVNRHVSIKKQAAAAEDGDVAVLKDSDLSKAIWLTNVQRDELLGQTHRDGQFLCSHGIMDYSLLLGIHNGTGGIDSSSNSKEDTSAGGAGGSGDGDGDGDVGGDVGGDGGDGGDEDGGGGGGAGGSSGETKDADVVDRWHSYHGGFKAYTGLRQDAENLEPAVIYVAIIDVLQQWTTGKKMENFVKTKIVIPAKQRKATFNADISAQNPYKYLDRFTAMARSLLEVFTKEHPRVSVLSCRSKCCIFSLSLSLSLFVSLFVILSNIELPFPLQSFPLFFNSHVSIAST